MKKLQIFLLMILSFNIHSQDFIDVPVKNLQTNINTVNTNSIEIKLELDFDSIGFSGYYIDDESFKEDKYICKLISESSVNNDEEVKLTVSRNGFVFYISNISSGLINLLKDSLADVYIKINKDIHFNALKNEDENTSIKFRLKKVQIKKSTRTKPILTESKAEELIKAKGGEIYLKENQLDYGIILPNTSSSEKTEFNLSYSYSKKYAIITKIPLFFYSEGLISTNAKDSQNYISIYPLSLNFFRGKHQISGQFGIKGNQDFTNYKAEGNLYYTGIISNFINLTPGQNRFRLRPVITAGVKIYQEIENNRPVEINNNEFSNQVFAELYYCIPIHKLFSLIIEGKAFYDWNASVNPDKELMYNYSATLGIDIPKTKFVTIFKYSNGENDISYQSNDYFILGIMIDLFDIN